MASITVNELVSSYNAGERDFSGIVLENADLSGLMLSKVDFSGSRMRGTNFSESVLIDANFKDAQLERSDFSRSNLRGANFENADLSWSNMREAFFDQTDMRKANLLWAHLCLSDLSNANIENAKLDWSCLAESKLTVDQMTVIENRQAESLRTGHESRYGSKTEDSRPVNPAGMKYSIDSPGDEDEVLGKEAGYASNIGKVKRRDIVEEDRDIAYK